MLGTYPFALAAGEAVAGFAKGFGQILVVFTLGCPAFSFYFLLIRGMFCGHPSVQYEQPVQGMAILRLMAATAS